MRMRTKFLTNVVLVGSLLLSACGQSVSPQPIPEGQDASTPPYSDFDKFMYGKWYTASEQERKVLASEVIGAWNADWQSWRLGNNHGEVYPIPVDDMINNPATMYTNPVARALPYLKENNATNETSVIVVEQNESAAASEYMRHPLVLAAQQYMDKRQKEVAEPLRYSINIIRTGSVDDVRYDVIIVEGKESNGINTENTIFGSPLFVGDGIVHVMPYEAILAAITKYDTASDDLGYSPNPADTQDGQAFITDVASSVFDYAIDSIPPPTAEMFAYQAKMQAIFPGAVLSWRYNPGHSIRRDGGRMPTGNQQDPFCTAYTLEIDGYDGIGLRRTLGSLTGMYDDYNDLYRQPIPPLYVFAELEQAQGLVSQGIDPLNLLDGFNPTPKLLTPEDLGGLDPTSDRACDPFQTVDVELPGKVHVGAWIGE